MQPFFARSSRNPSQTCAISNTVLSSRPVPAKSTFVDHGDNGGGSALMRKFGDFYKRFYSSMSEAVAEERNREWGLMDIGDRDNVCSSGSILSAYMPGESMAGSTSGHQPEHESKASESAHGAGVASEQSVPARAIQLSTFTMPKQCSRGDVRELELSDSECVVEQSTPERLRRPMNERLMVEALSRKLVGTIMRHEQLMMSLEKELKERLRNHVQICERERPSNAERIQSLRSAIQELTMRYYEPPSSTTANEIDHERSLTSSSSLSRYPQYAYLGDPIELNRTLYKLLHTRPPSPHLMPKICYHIVKSEFPPSVQTYNILINGLVLLRLNSLAHIIFRTMVDSNMRPDDYTVVALLHLCIKSDDRDGFWRVQRIIQSQSVEIVRTLRQQRLRRPRSKMVLEALIVGAAKFGDTKKVVVFLRAMKRECPWSPRAGLRTLTALLALWTKKRSDKSLAIWKQMEDMEKRWRRSGDGEPLDLRAFHGMVKYCEALGMRQLRDYVLAEAAKRGFTAEEVLRPPDKTRGLWEMAWTKTPRVRDILKEHEQVISGQPPLQSKHLQRIMRNVTDSDLASVLVPIKPVADEFTGLIISSVKKEPTSADGLSQLEKSRLWDKIVFQRMKTSGVSVESLGYNRTAFSIHRKLSRAQPLAFSNISGKQYRK